MSRANWERWAPVSGILYAVLYAVGVLLIVADTIDEKSDAELLSYFADSGNRSGHIVGFFLVVVGLLFFLLFVSALGSRLRAAESEPRILAPLAVGAGVAAAALLVVASAVLAGTAFAADWGDDFVVDPNSVRLVFWTGYVLLIGSVSVMSVLVAATSVLALRTSVLPTWLGWVGLGAVVLAVIEAFLLPAFVVPAWTALVSVVLIVRTQPS